MLVKCYFILLLEIPDTYKRTKSFGWLLKFEKKVLWLELDTRLRYTSVSEHPYFLVEDFEQII